MKPVHMALIFCGLFGACATPQFARAAATVAVRREPPEGALRLGQRIRVDDGTCPAGHVKEVTAGQLTAKGIARQRVCVKR